MAMPYLAAGAAHSLLVLKSGRLCAWGNGAALGIGDPDQSYFHALRVTNMPASTIGIAAGNWSSLAAVGMEAGLWTWGINAYGELALPFTSNSAGAFVSSPEPRRRMRGVLSIDGGENHTLAVHKSGAMASWGANTHGQLGNGPADAGFHYRPRYVLALPRPAGSARVDRDENLQGVVMVAAGDRFSLALLDDGTVASWGENTFSQLGWAVSPGPLSANPGRVKRLRSIQKIAAGGSHALALDTEGRVYSWGLNEEGQLGRLGATVPVGEVPGVVADIKGVVDIAAGNNFSLALDRKGKIWSWGSNAFGRLGRGSVALGQDARPGPIATIGLEFVAIAAGVGHALAVDSTDGVWAWGVNHMGQLGAPQIVQPGTGNLIPYNPVPMPVRANTGALTR